MVELRRIGREESCRIMHFEVIFGFDFLNGLRNSAVTSSRGARPCAKRRFHFLQPSVWLVQLEFQVQSVYGCT